MESERKKYTRKKEIIEDEGAVVCRAELSKILNEALDKLGKVPLMALSNTEVTAWRNLYKNMTSFNKLLMSK